MLRLAQTMFDTKLPPGVSMLQPFSEESSIKKIAVRVYALSLPSFIKYPVGFYFMDNSMK
jgi:aarF domain-containing kinase